MAAARRARCRWARWSSRCKKLVGNGYREVVLTGVDITSYGPDLPGTPTLGKLVQAILRHVPDLPRLRISSIDSIEADAALYRRHRVDRRLMPHLHLSLQSGDDMILKRMKRRHLARRYAGLRRASPRARGPTWCSAPTSSPASRPRPRRCSRTRCGSSSEAGLTYLHVFPYSPRPGTPAARMPQVGGGVARRARASDCATLGERAVRGSSREPGRARSRACWSSATASAAPSSSCPIALPGRRRRARSCRCASPAPPPTGLVGEALRRPPA